MGDPGLPDDFGPSYPCDACGGRNHPSGTETCACAELTECNLCGEEFPGSELSLSGECEDCLLILAEDEARHG